jgi:hypothetical protein
MNVVQSLGIYFHVDACSSAVSPTPGEERSCTEDVRTRIVYSQENTHFVFPRVHPPSPEYCVCPIAQPKIMNSSLPKVWSFSFRIRVHPLCFLRFVLHRYILFHFSATSILHHSISIIRVATYIVSFYSSKMKDHPSSGSNRLAGQSSLSFSGETKCKRLIRTIQPPEIRALWMVSYR